MHPELLYSIVTARHKELHRQTQFRHWRTVRPARRPLGTLPAAKRVRTSIGVALVAAGTRLQRGAPGPDLSNAPG
jgi:hypothetical protein